MKVSEGIIRDSMLVCCHHMAAACAHMAEGVNRRHDYDKALLTLSIISPYKKKVIIYT